MKSQRTLIPVQQTAIDFRYHIGSDIRVPQQIAIATKSCDTVIPLMSQQVYLYYAIAVHAHVGKTSCLSLHYVLLAMCSKGDVA